MRPPQSELASSVDPTGNEMTTSTLINAEPVIHIRRELPNYKRRLRSALETDELMPDLIDEIEVFHQLKDINDPEHPYSLEQAGFRQAS